VRLAVTASERALAAFAAALAERLTAAGTAASDVGTAAALREFAGLVESIDSTGREKAAAAPACQLPVCRFWDAALADASGAVGSLAGALSALAPALSWTQNPNYRRQPPDARFLANYGYAVIAGPADGPPALATDARLALGVLLLGPGTHYPLHGHPAAEVYYTLTPGGEWWRGTGPWRQEPPGAAIYHAPNVPHATRAGALPVLAVYLWRGDLDTHARLAGADR
jgi:quercetin dioxygenase-like cupin family protein